MGALRNILVLMDPGSGAQPAFDAAVLVARATGARLELLATEYHDLHAGYFEPMTATLQEFHDSVLAARRAMLGRYVQAAAEAGVTALGEALWGSPFHEVVLARVAATRPDLVVKHTEYHGRVERTIFTGSDWHLIRDCPVPLLLVKDPARLSGAKVLACVDPMHAHDKPAALDVELLRRGTELATLLGGELHALHVAALPAPVVMVGDVWVAAAAVPPPEESLALARAACERLAAERGVSRQRLHLRVGAPAHEIVATARELGAGLLMMGAVSRRRLERWFVGSTAEAVLDRAPCNVWVEKPASP
ncbi:MAG: universal stress protein [Steroidobacteraceae bacterium]